MNQPRPTLARVHTRSTETKRNDELDAGVRITKDGDVFEVRFGDVTPALAAECRKATGMSFRKLMEELSEDPDVDLLTAFEWVARRIRGEDVSLSDVEFGYADMMADDFDVTATASAPADEGDDPEV